MSEWKLIESAPRDGTKILVCGKILHGDPFVAAYHRGLYQDRDWLDMRTKTRPFNHALTHWQPLPKPPDET